MVQSPTEAPTPVGGYAPPASPGIPRRHLLVLGLAAIAILALFGFFSLITRQPEPAEVVKGLIGSLSARDAVAAEYLDDAAQLPEVARSMGIEALPASIKVEVADVEVRQVETGDKEFGEVAATWTLSATGERGHAAQAAQEATFSLAKNAAGRWVVIGWDITPAIGFDLAEYYGSSGTSAADRDRALDDLQKGVVWVGSVAVEPDDATTNVTADPVYTDDPDAFDTQVTTTSEGVVGDVTHWGVSFTGTDLPGFQVAEAKTLQERPSQITRGILTTDGVIGDATSWINDWVRGVQGGDAAALASVTDATTVSTAAWQRMQIDGLEIPGQAEATLVAENPITVTYGPITVIRQKGGGWMVNTTTSLLMHDWLVATGTPIKVHSNPALVDFSNCGGSLTGADVRIRLEGVAMYGDNLDAVAVLRLDATGDLDCSDGVPISKLAVSWNGHKTPEPLYPESTSDEGARTYLRITLPSGIDAQAAPIKVDVTIESMGWDRLDGGHSTFTAGT